VSGRLAGFPVRQASLSAVSLIGGVSLAAIPAATLSISSHTFTTAQQGYVSVVITASTLISQLAFAVVVESRLSSPLTERRVTFPRWLGAISLLAALAVIVQFTSPIVLCFALPVLLSSLEVGRGVSVAEHLDHREVWAAILVGLGALGGIGVAYLGGPWGLVPLVVGVAAASVVRSLAVPHHASRRQAGVTGWVVTDVAITGIIYPALNSVILLFIGPIGAVLFAAISSVSGLLAIPLNFVRLRLLKAHSSLDIWIGGAAVALAIVVIGILEFTGVLGFVFEGSWTIGATVAALTIACLWRAASLATTLPFAALRRAGHVRLLAVLRGCCAAATFLGGLAVLPLHSLTAVFLVLLLGELTQATTYEIARRRTLRRAANAAS
jgi:hypothetical protein